jgi:uncharacterized membrane protein
VFVSVATVTAPQLRLGDIFGISFKILSRNAAAFGVLALIFSLPWEIYWDYVTYFGDVDSTDALSSLAEAGEGMALTVVETAFTGLATGAIAYGTFRDLSGEPAGFLICVRRGLALVAPVIAVVLLSSLLTLAGSLAIVIPGLIIYTVLWLVVPVTVVERPGIVDSLRRSRALTKGYRWQIFGVILILGMANGVILGLIEEVIAPSEATLSTLLPYVFISLAATAALTAFEAVVTTVTYDRLRTAKEGTATFEIARIFD